MRTGGDWPPRSAVIEDGDAEPGVGERTGAAGARLLVHSQDGLGLGHLPRTSAIAAEVSDSPLTTFSGTVLLEV